MNETTLAALRQKNEALIDRVIERAKRDFPEDIVLIGLTGSFQTGDFHEKSDLDLIIVNETERGWGIAECFILGDVGYDIYCTPWSPRLEASANLESPMVSCLLDLEVLYVAKPEAMEKLKALQQRARELLSRPIGRESLALAKKDLDRARQSFADAMLSDAPGPVRYAAYGVLYHLVNALVRMNQQYIRRGVKRYLEELRTYAHLPESFETLYMDVLRAGSIDALREASRALLQSVLALYDRMVERFVEKPVPTYENTRGLYEELWCNCRNKVLASAQSGDLSYAAHAALGAQNYVDEIADCFGFPAYDLMARFDPAHLDRFPEAFQEVVDAYQRVYDQVGRKVNRFDSFEALYAHYMRRPEER